MATFISSYETGHLPMFANLFDDDAQADLQRGRAAIRSEYDQVFRSTLWRRMSISQLRWQSVGDRTEGRGELMSKIGWRMVVKWSSALRCRWSSCAVAGDVVIARLSLQPRIESQ
jgi:hypothetical protein